VAAQFVYLTQPRNKTPNDIQYPNQWSLPKVHAPELWDITTGGKTATGTPIVVAVLDYAFKVTQEDIAPNIWRNKDEIPNNGIDDDQNGYIDDYFGWNNPTGTDQHIFAGNMGDSHGTNCMGVIGAKGDNQIGISGINWDVQLMPSSGIRDDIQIVEAYLYALKQRKLYNQTMGAKGALVVATSFSSGFINTTAAEHPVFCNVYEMLGEEGIVNVVACDNDIKRVEITGDIPSLCISSHLIVVTDTDQNDKLQGAFSQNRVHLGAPGYDVPLAFNNNFYSNGAGTSFAAPLVAGAVALLYSLPDTKITDELKTNPKKSGERMRQSILSSAEPVPSLKDLVVTSGRLHVWNAYQNLRRSFGIPLGEYQFTNIFPNPTNGLLHIQLQLPQGKTAYLQITNTLGQVLSNVTLKEADYFANSVDIPTSGLAAGAYFISIVSDNAIQVSRRFVVVD
jgi:Subtilase family/Secretion system C-terminal sorting domain